MMQSFARCIIFVAVVIGFSLHVCLFVCSCVCFFGQCYLAAKCPICGGLLDRINAVLAASLDVCCSLVILT